MDIPKLAVPTFVAGPLEKTAAVDIYKEKGNTVINSIQAFGIGNGINLSGLLAGGSFFKTGVSILKFGTALKDVKFTKAALIARLAASVPNVVTILRGADDSLLSSIGDNVVQGSQVFATINGVTRAIKGESLGKVSELGKVINAVSNNRDAFSVKDENTQVGLISGLVKEATRYGIPNSLPTLLTVVDSPRTQQRISALVLPDFIAKGDIGGLGDVHAAAGPGAAQLLYPALIPDISANYALPDSCTRAQYADEFTRIKETYRAVSPQWDSVKRAGSSVLDISKIAKGSKDFSKVLQDGASGSPVVEEQFYALSGLFKSKPVDVELKKQFPSMVLTDLQRSVKPTSDPRANWAAPVTQRDSAGKELITTQGPSDNGSWMYNVTIQ
jgi:hypothetical protein